MRSLTWALISTSTFTFALLLIARTDEVVVANGKLEPIGEVKEIQIPVGGITESILIKEGDSVVKGQILIQLDSDVSKNKVDSIMNFVGFKNRHHYLIKNNNDSISFQKIDKRFEFDFNAIAQGYSVDVIADFFNSKNIKNYFIELGGEIKVKGLNQDNIPWNIGIDKPQKNNKNERNGNSTETKKIQHSVTPKKRLGKKSMWNTKIIIIF